MDNRTKIIVILPVHNRLNITRNFIKCLNEQTYKNYILLLIDDGCTDDTVDYIKQKIENLIVLSGDGNLWWAGSLNMAYKFLVNKDYAGNDIVLIANDDVLFDADYFEKLIVDISNNDGSIIISPGHDIHSDFIERGFLINWKNLLFHKMYEDGEPDAITTRCLYMKYHDYKKIGGFYPKLLPQYLSDLEYTIRAKRIGYKLHISKLTSVKVDRKTTGQHIDNSIRLRDFLYHHFISKKTAYNITYWSTFIILTAPWKYKIRCLYLLYKRFGKRFLGFVYLKYSI